MRYGLLSLPNAIKVFKAYGGLPFALDPCSPTTVHEDSKLRLLRPCLTYLAYIASAAYIQTEYNMAYGYGEEGNTNMAMYLEIPEFEVYLISVVLLVSVILTTLAFIILVVQRKGICSIYHDVFELTSMVKENGAVMETGKIGSLTVCFWYTSSAILMAVGCLTYTWANLRGYQKATDQLEIQPWRQWFYAFIVFLYTIGIFSHPLMGVINALPMDIVHSMVDCLNGLTSIIIKDGIIDQQILNVGIRICKLGKDMNKTFSIFFLYSFGYFLTGGLVYMYGAIDIAMVSSDYPSMLVCISFLCFASLWYQFMFMVSFTANKVKDSKEALQEALENLFLASKIRRDDKIIECKDILMRRLNKMAISPCNYFEVGNVSVLGVFATLITYLIIALQFRGA